MRWLKRALWAVSVSALLAGCSGRVTPPLDTGTPTVTPTLSQTPTATPVAEEPGWKTFRTPDERLVAMLPEDVMLVRDDARPEVITISGKSQKGAMLELQYFQYPTDKRARQRYDQRVADARQIQTPGKILSTRDLKEPKGTVIEFADGKGGNFTNAVIVHEDLLVDLLITQAPGAPEEATKIVESLRFEKRSLPAPSESPVADATTSTPNVTPATPDHATTPVPPSAATPGAVATPITSAASPSNTATSRPDAAK